MQYLCIASNSFHLAAVDLLSYTAEPKTPRPKTPRLGGDELPPRTVEKKQRCRPDGKETDESKFITANGSDFSEPVYKEIAIAKGCIDRMGKEEFRAKLSKFKRSQGCPQEVTEKLLHEAEADVERKSFCRQLL